MTTLLVRDADDNRRAHSVLSGPRGRDVTDLRYEGWPRLVFDSDKRLDLIRCAGNLEAMRETAEHHYCLIRYGTADRRNMTEADKAAARISAHFENNSHTIVIDLSHAMNGAAQAAKTRAAEGGGGGTANLFAGLRSDTDDGGKESNARALREIGTTVANRLPASNLTRVLMLGVVSFAIGWTCVKGIEAGLEYAFRLKVQEDSQQLRIAELNARQLSDADGKRVQLSAHAKQTLAREDTEDARRVALLSEMELEHPLLRFVAAEAHAGLADTLDMAPELANIRINGMAMSAATARGGAKALRRAATAKRGWVTEVIFATDI